MKVKKTLAVACAMAMLLALSGCTSGGSSSSSRSSSSSSASSKTSSSSSAASSSMSEGSSVLSDLESRIESGLESMEESVSPTMSTDFAEIGALNGEALGWGPGGPVDSENRSQGAVAYQEKYGKYDAYFIAPSSEKIYLTFDEGYENGYTADILDTLKEKGVHAVFFVTLPYVKEQPELVQRMIDEGHIVGNHSVNHLSMPTISMEDCRAEVMGLHEYVKENFGYEMSLFRFPMGEFSEADLSLLQQLGYRSVFWSFAYRDWLVDEQPDPQQAIETIESKCHPGAIYLLHAVSQTNAQILGQVIDDLRAQGYTFCAYGE